MTKRVALYLRVSTDGQTTKNQRRELQQVARARGWDVAKVYDDDGVSGAKGREYRRAFDRMLKDAARGEFDMVAAWSVDRLGRSLQDLVTFLSELKALSVDLYLHKQALDTSTPSGRAMFGMLSVFSEFEREMIVERVRAGIARARAEGKTLGRPRVTAEVEDAIRDLRAEGMGMTAISKTLGAGSSTVTRVLAE